ncbi:MAG: hypothetical protein M9887_00315 [Chitinophagales bacterium]|nr:hypothetical protein [Chitinophagales bacterium]
MPYPLAILLLPHRFKNAFVIIIAFAIGFILDFSLNTGGLHAASLTLLAYLRGYLLNILKPTTESTDNSFISLKNTNLGWFLIYTFILLLVQQFSYYLFESFTFNNLTFIIKKTMVGSISSTFIILLILLLFKNSAKNRN